MFGSREQRYSCHCDVLYSIHLSRRGAHQQQVFKQINRSRMQAPPPPPLPTTRPSTCPPPPPPQLPDPPPAPPPSSARLQDRLTDDCEWGGGAGRDQLAGARQGNEGKALKQAKPEKALWKAPAQSLLLQTGSLTVFWAMDLLLGVPGFE